MPAVLVDVLLPLAIQSLFSYRVPESLVDDLAVGKRVIVTFGKNKIYSALIKRIQHTTAAASELKEIQAVLDEFPVVTMHQLKLWEWMAEYYMCTEGEVMSAALPAALKLQSETLVFASTNGEPDNTALTENEETLLEALKEKNEMTIGEIERLLDKKNVHQILKKALEKNLIMMTEEISQRFKPRKETHIRLSDAYKDESKLEELFHELEQNARKAKQLETLMVFMKFLFDDPARSSVKKAILTGFKDVSKSSVESLIKSEILTEFEIIVDRIPVPTRNLIDPLALSEAQQISLNEVKKCFVEKDVTLLRGVTSSGKTEIYIHLINDMLKEGKQVLYLLPEIALTTQLIVRLQKYFGDKVGVYHSKYSGNERAEVWNHVLNFDPQKLHNRSQIVIGARSALFLPFSQLGFVIVDEEHDHSYKQQDPAPRYNGRDSSIMLAKLHEAKSLLGSATPSLESFFNVSENRFALVNLMERYGGIKMPEIIVADVKESKRKKIMKSHFTPELMEAMKTALDNKEQIILFQNRRGFSNFLECRNCNFVPHCKNCSVTLTYHKHQQILKCHYCGHAENVPSVCPNCGDFHLEIKGFGTEKIEEEVAVFFPETRIARMDLDTTRTRTSYQKIITDFEDRKIDILVGTQMVTKGLDFDNISTVGIIDADQLLNFPDFRSFERSFQLMAQVSGRSGRKQKQGKVIIQTQQPAHWVITDVVANDYEKFYKRDLQERHQFEYPPYSRLIELTLRHKQVELLQEASEVLVELMRKKLGERIYGPHIPLVEKIRNLFYRNIIIKVERKISSSEVKRIIKESLMEFHKDRSYLSIQVIPNVDPL